MSRFPKRSLTRDAVIFFSALLLFVVGNVAYRAWEDPLVEYKGNVIRNSVLMDQTEISLYCKDLVWFSLDVSIKCFDSEEELEQFMRANP